MYHRGVGALECIITVTIIRIKDDLSFTVRST